MKSFNQVLLESFDKEYMLKKADNSLRYNRDIKRYDEMLEKGYISHEEWHRRSIKRLDQWRQEADDLIKKSTKRMLNKMKSGGGGGSTKKVVKMSKGNKIALGVVGAAAGGAGLYAAYKSHKNKQALKKESIIKSFDDVLNEVLYEYEHMSNNQLNEFIEPISLIGGAIAGGIAAALLAKSSRDAVKGTKICKARTKNIQNETLRKKSFLKCQIDKLDKMIAFSHREIPKCNKEKNPDRCIKGMNSLINRLQKFKADISKDLSILSN